MTAIISDPSEAQGQAALPPRSADGEVVRGRDAERRVVGDLLRRARRGIGGVVLVEGEPGIGKSTLLRACIDMAAELGFSLVAGAADQLGRAVPFSVLRAALGEPFARLTAGPGDHGPGDAVAWWISRMLADLEQRSSQMPVLVCLDDVQWASPTTLAALRTLQRELRSHPVAWLLARSSVPEPGSEYLFSLLESGGAARISLGPLSEDVVAALLADATGAPPGSELLDLAAGAAGNLALLAALADGLRANGTLRVTEGRAMLVSDGLPERVHNLARQRLASVGGQARQLLVTAAALGPRFRLEDAAEMLGQVPAVLLTAVQEAMAAGIVAAAEDAFWFRQPMLRRAVSEMIPGPGRAALHRQYGQLLLARGESAAAEHLLLAARSGSPASLADLDTAVAQTLPKAPHTAAALAVRTLEITPPAGPSALPRAVAAAEALAAAGRLEEAARIAGEALGRPLPPADEARLRCALSSVLCSRGQARDAAAEAMTVLDRPQLPAGLRDTAITAHLQAVTAARDEQAGRLADTVLAAPGHHASHTIAAALTARAAVHWDNGQVSEALTLVRDAARQCAGISPDARHAQPLLALAATLTDLRQLSEAEAILRATDSQLLPPVPVRAAVSLLRARIHLAGGRVADAAAAARETLDTASASGAHAYADAARCVLAVTALRRGDITAAAAHMAADTPSGPHAASSYARAETALARAQLREAREGPTAAISEVRTAYDRLQARPGMLLGDPAAAAWLTRTAMAAGETEMAAGIARAAQALAAASPSHPAVIAAAAHAAGLAGADPARLAAAAVAHPDPWARASAAEDLGALHARRSERDDAITHLTEAAGGYQDAEPTADAARVRRRLRKLGVRRRHWTQSAQRPVTGWESLTDAERASAELVAQGLNNRQVAARMYVSTHTVAFYMRQAYRKLNIGTRVELTRIVIGQALQAAAAGQATAGD